MNQSQRLLPLTFAIFLILSVSCQTATPKSVETELIQPVNTITTKQSTPIPAEQYDQYEIITVLPKDAIPAIDHPEFLSLAEADQFYESDELIIGVVFEGEARAYSVPLLSRHEIVNDQIGPLKFAVTW